MENVEKYIRLINNMFTIPKQRLEAMRVNSQLMAEELKYYSWEDIKWAVEMYYAKKNDKTYPKLSQITAILNANGKKGDIYTPEAIKRPTTNLNAIKTVFEDVCRKLFEHGIVFNDYFDRVEKLKFGNKNIIKDGRIWNREWDWEDGVELAKRNFPQEFMKFKKLGKYEEYAIAYKLGCIKCD